MYENSNMSNISVRNIYKTNPWVTVYNSILTAVHIMCPCKHAC